MFLEISRHKSEQNLIVHQNVKYETPSQHVDVHVILNYYDNYVHRGLYPN